MLNMPFCLIFDVVLILHSHFEILKLKMPFLDDFEHKWLKKFQNDILRAKYNSFQFFVLNGLFDHDKGLLGQKKCRKSTFRHQFALKICI